jgi:hypothetical protein
MEKLIIEMGFPGSGKTRFAQRMKEKNEYEVAHINIDHLIHNFKYNKHNDSVDKFAQVILDNINPKYRINIIDGLILTNDDVVKIIKNLPYFPDKSVEIHYWHENKEACLWNDRYRRDTNSELTIKNATLEKLSLSYITEKIEEFHPEREFYLSAVAHKVQKKSELQMFIDKYKINIDEDNKLKSGSWQTGGHWWSYTGATGAISGEDQPLSFDELDNLLEKIAPSISFLEYKKIMKNCVTIESDTQRDYYSEANISYFECDVQKLYDILLQYNKIETEEY